MSADALATLHATKMCDLFIFGTTFLWLNNICSICSITNIGGPFLTAKWQIALVSGFEANEKNAFEKKQTAVSNIA